ncbi:class I SAM-dependent methyltransferase [Thermomonas carbonis]|uniref:Class I SAM-dependent methyltransferase n=1 Tax=Thermomonas carbonis TaxID=1463158 RepID=A0A7G9SLI9_9GAMM|nr:class I SAM-dependent methyltransferase [Thermomonas carbonis]QNN68714.1 class I SAM-dependent methyltransferase [Thermomonas carbonis]GHC09312.1 SAM-dependent methyltransferase [Thermomonas carbonis]
MTDRNFDRSRAFEALYPEHEFGGYTNQDGAVAFYSRVQSLLRRDSIVCDFGCGRGFHKDLYRGFARDVQVFTRKAKHVVGVDVDSYAAENPYIDEFRLISPMDAPLPLASESVDLVVTEWVVEHLPNPRDSLDELSRVIKPGGFLCIRTPNLWHYSCLAALMIPDRLHYKVRQLLRQPHESEDVFPTLYRANTRGLLASMLEERGFDAVVYRHRGPSHLTEAGRFLGQIGEWIERFSPAVFHHELHAFARKRVTTPAGSS